MTKVKITSIGQTDTVGLFSIIFADQQVSEFARFVAKIQEDGRRSRDLYQLLAEISKIETNGALERYFRYEGKVKDHVVALPTYPSGIRLYCLRLSDEILILGNGGIKGPGPYQNYPDLNGYVINLQKLDELLFDDIRKGVVSIDSPNFTGAPGREYDL